MNTGRIRNGVDLLLRIAQENPGSLNRSSGWQARLAAGLWIKNDLVDVGWNQAKTSPFQATWGRNQDSIYLHAEIHLLKQVLNRISQEELARSKTTLIVTRVKKPNTERGRRIYPDEVGMAKPCAGCMGAIQAFGIRRVIWTTGGTLKIPHWEMIRF